MPNASFSRSGGVCESGLSRRCERSRNGSEIAMNQPLESLK